MLPYSLQWVSGRESGSWLLPFYSVWVHFPVPYFSSPSVLISRSAEERRSKLLCRCMREKLWANRTITRRSRSYSLIHSHNLTHPPHLALVEPVQLLFTALDLSSQKDIWHHTVTSKADSTVRSCQQRKTQRLLPSTFNQAKMTWVLATGILNLPGQVSSSGGKIQLSSISRLNDIQHVAIELGLLGVQQKKRNSSLSFITNN